MGRAAILFWDNLLAAKKARTHDRGHCWTGFAAPERACGEIRMTAARQPDGFLRDDLFETTFNSFRGKRGKRYTRASYPQR